MAVKYQVKSEIRLVYLGDLPTLDILARGGESMKSSSESSRFRFDFFVRIFGFDLKL